jgi:molybdenum cofactor guanylyltransferase
LKKQEVKVTSKEHNKHAKLTRPSYGNFARNEWAIVGTTCDKIKALADELIKALSPTYKCCYIDAQHSKADEEATLPGKLASGATIEYTNEISYQQFNYKGILNNFEYRQIFNEVDVALINGNHFEAKAQVVVIDSIKKASLQKRLPQLNNVKLILLADNEDEVFDFVKEALAEWHHLPIYKFDETDKIVDFCQAQMNEPKPVLNGLVLAGGKSVRMGHDKGLIDWHGKEQRYFIADLLNRFCNDVFISCRDEQQQEIDFIYKTLPDTFIGLGPYGAILSAFRDQPNAAWLVIASDLPLIDEDTINYLTQHRDTSSIATTFESPYDNFPEPLISIWEPKSYPVLLSFLAQGYSCPRKVLINSDTTVLNAHNVETLMNVNTPEEFAKAKEILEKKKATG